MRVSYVGGRSMWSVRFGVMTTRKLNKAGDEVLPREQFNAITIAAIHMSPTMLFSARIGRRETEYPNYFLRNRSVSLLKWIHGTYKTIHYFEYLFFFRLFTRKRLSGFKNLA